MFFFIAVSAIVQIDPKGHSWLARLAKPEKPEPQHGSVDGQLVFFIALCNLGLNICLLVLICWYFHKMQRLERERAASARDKKKHPHLIVVFDRDHDRCKYGVLK